MEHCSSGHNHFKTNTPKNNSQEVQDPNLYCDEVTTPKQEKKISNVCPSVPKKKIGAKSEHIDDNINLIYATPMTVYRQSKGCKKLQQVLDYDDTEPIDTDNLLKVDE